MTHRIWWCWQKERTQWTEILRVRLSRTLAFHGDSLAEKGSLFTLRNFLHILFSIILLTIMNNRVGWGESYWKPLFYIYWKEIIFGLFWTMFGALKQTPGPLSLPTLQIPLFFLIFHRRSCKSSVLSAAPSCQESRPKTEAQRVGDLSQSCELTLAWKGWLAIS